MSGSSIALALRIALLLEEYSEKELEIAVKLLRDRGGKSGLLDLLSRDSGLISPKTKSLANPARPIEDTTSLAVLQLRDADPEKYRLMSEFDRMVRRGQILRTHEDLKRFGERISKDFQPRKSRKDTIGHLVATLAERPLLEIERLVEFAASFDVSGSADDYQKLAQFLIEGRPKSDL